MPTNNTRDGRYRTKRVEASGNDIESRHVDVLRSHSPIVHRGEAVHRTECNSYASQQPMVIDRTLEWNPGHREQNRSFRDRDERQSHAVASSRSQLLREFRIAVEQHGIWDVRNVGNGAHQGHHGEQAPTGCDDNAERAGGG